MSKGNRFQALSAAIKGEDLPEVQQEENVSAEPASSINPAVAKRGRARGKRSNPDFEQVGAYIPKALNLEVKRLLLEEDIDFSELIAKLLQKWVDKNKLLNQ